MEKWQQARIRRNLPRLLEYTNCSTQLLALLQAENVLCASEAECIKAEKTPQDKAALFYSALLSKLNGFRALLKSLEKVKQTGALQLLQKISTEEIGNLQVRLLNKTGRLHEFLNPEQVQQVQNWTQDNLSPEEYQNVIGKALDNNTSLDITRRTIPALPLLYIPRFLSRRVVVRSELFTEKSNDVFVFKQIDRTKLRKFAGYSEIDGSTKQTLFPKPKARFILLQLENDWNLLCSKSSAPVHLLRYEESTEAFLLEATTGDATKLDNYLEKMSREKGEHIPEETFISKVLDQNERRVCICDLPGMGKTSLFASVAHQMTKLDIDRIVAFVELKELALQKCDIAFPLPTILKQVSASKFALCFLNVITQIKNIRFDLFFDGLDEVEYKNLELVLSFLESIAKTMPESRIFVTSRPVTRHQLEKAIGAISYDIQPFNYQTQLYFIKTTWIQNNPSSSANAFIKYAELCLKNLQQTLKIQEKEITGIPLLCKLISEAYAEQAIAYCKTSDVKPTEFPHSLMEIYRHFMDRQLGKTECRYACMSKQYNEVTCGTTCKVRSYHVWVALNIILPNFANKLQDEVNSFGCITIKHKMAPGILTTVQISDHNYIKFLHRTLAEYLVADFIAHVVFGSNYNSGLVRRYGRQSIEQWAFLQVYKTARPPNDNLYVESSSLREGVVAYFLNEIVTETEQTGQYFTKAIISPSKPKFRNALVGCLKCDFEALFEILLCAAKRSQISYSTSGKFVDQPKYTYIHGTIDTVTKYCTAKTFDKLYQFYLQQYNCDIFESSYSQILCLALRNVIKRGNYELVQRFIDKVSLENNQFLHDCLIDTDTDSDELVNKKLEVAQKLISMCPSLVSGSDDTMLSVFPEGTPLFTKNLSLKAIKLLVDNGTDIRKKQNCIFRDTYEDPTFLHLVAKYMIKEDIVELCRLVFIQKPVDDLFYLFSQPGLKFTFYFSRARALLSIVHLFGQVPPTVSHEILNTFWEAGNTTPVDAILRNTINLQAKSLLCLQKCQLVSNLFCVAVEEGDVIVADILLGQDDSLLDMQFDKKRTALHLAVENQQIEMFKYLVSKLGNIFALDEYSQTILHIAKAKDINWYDCVSEIIKQIPSEQLENITARSFCHTEGTIRVGPKNLQELFHWKDKFKNTPCMVSKNDIDL